MNKTGRQIITGLIIALASVGIVLGGFSLSMKETGLVSFTASVETTAIPTDFVIEVTATLEPQIITPTLPIPATTAPAGASETPTLTSTPTYTATSTRIVPPGRTSTAVPCSAHPNNWVPYMVQPHDTLYSLYRLYGVPVADLQRYNCLQDPNVLNTGQIIYVPGYVTLLPTDTLVYPLSPTPSETPVGTPTTDILPTETSTVPPTDTPDPAAGTP